RRGRAGRRRAPRLRWGASSMGAISGLLHSRDSEERHGSAGARRTLGGMGAISGPRHSRDSEERHGSAGARRTSGGMGAISGPPFHMTGLRTRVLVLAGILALALAGAVGRHGWLEMARHGAPAALPERQYSRTVVLQAQRGPIVARHGAALAPSSPAESLFAQPRAVGDPVRVAARLAPLLGVPERELHAQLTSGRQFVWLRRKL